MIPLSTFLFELILIFFFSEALWFSLFISSGHDRPDPTPTPPPTPHTIMWQVSLYADRSHSCTLTRQRFKYRNSSECLSPNWTLFANAVTISHLCWYCLTLEKGSADVSEILRFIHRSTSCFFHCVRRNRSHTSQRRYWYRCPVWRVAESWALTY